uniref:mRNA (guanine-N(7))-methyltransferase n=1 Tax=viral metagenome TaxID=1070528 RepID=A0A6C0HXY3_9ZZZZ
MSEKREPLKEEPERKKKEDEEYEQQRQKTKNIMKTSKEELEKRLKQYLDSVPSVKQQNKSKEFEIRFGKYSQNGKNISKIDYDNVIKQIMAAGFVSTNQDGIQILRIYSEYQDPKTGQTKMSNIRAEIVGTDLISEYCSTNSIDKLQKMPSTHANKLKFTQKTSTLDKEGKYQRPIDFPDMGFRVDFKYEEDFGINSRISQNIIRNWANNKKKFRFINRVQFKHPEYPILVDISIVKSSMQIRGKVDYPTYTIQESHLFENPETYEVELEIDNMRVGQGDYDNVMNNLRKVIRIIMSGIQGSSYPIPLSERDDVLQGYLSLIHGEEYKRKYVSSNDFVGPSSYTLQIDNIVDQKNSKLANIRKDYTVTDKADGDRKMLYVNDKGLIYLIDTNMNVQFTGSKTEHKLCLNSLLDGEHIKYNKFGEFINLYKSFDIYFINSKSFMENPFFPRPADIDKPEETTESEKKEPLPRFKFLEDFIKVLKPISTIKEAREIWKEQTTKKGEKFWFERISGKIQKEKPLDVLKKNAGCNIRVECKEFLSDISIFDSCSTIMSKIKDNVYEYNTDGLIFTPAYSPVGSIAARIPGLLHKYTWDESFKWKPAEFNTIDFLVEVYKENGKDKIKHIFQEGTNVGDKQTIIEYKTLILRCGVDTKKHMFENAFNDIIHERIPSPGDIDNESTYEARPFEPTDPYDPFACICNIIVKNSGDDERNWVMTTENDEYFEENTIVEFRYEKDAEPGWNWRPIRVRHDKTQKLLQGQKEYGNAYHVANSNWYSIHHPVTKEMITSGQNLPEIESNNEDIYYMGALEDSRTSAMRNFHNLYVKKKLILGVANPENTLIDYAVGKGGDLAKWRQGRLSMVLGIDLSRDNISGATDNACVRYLKDCQKYENVPYCLFLRGDSSQNIRELEAFPGDKTSKERMIASAIFGKGPKDSTLLGKGIYNRYGIGEQGFNISSCQFALHYFFENPNKLHGFIRNVAECTRVQGYFITTGYDGEKVFKLLRKKKEDEGVAFFTQDRYGKKKMICEIIKKYSQEGFYEDETSIGYRIHVYQETIQKTSIEYLVSFKYFVRIMENYGFELVKDEEAMQMGLPHASGLFEELFTSMKTEIDKDAKRQFDYKKALNMSDVEKEISFLNRYCVFRKVASVSKETMDKFAKQASAMYANESDNEVNPELEAIVDKVLNEKSASTGNVKKLKVRIILKSVSNKSNRPTESVGIVEENDDLFDLKSVEREPDEMESEAREPQESQEKEVKPELEENPKQIVVIGKKRFIPKK